MTSFIHRISLFLILFAAPLAAASPKLYEKLGGSNLDILRNAKFVTILTLVPDGTKSIQEVHLNADEIDRLKKNILDDHNYQFDKTKSCHFNPELSFKFIDGEKGSVLVFVSPVCNQILFGTDTHSVLLDYDSVAERIEPFFQQLINETRSRNKT